MSTTQFYFFSSFQNQIRITIYYTNKQNALTIPLCLNFQQR